MDIVERLRLNAMYAEDSRNEAADTIESLRARVAELEADNKEMNSHLSRIGAILDDVDYLGEHSVGVQALKKRVAELEAGMGEPVAKIVRNTAGQISIFDPNGDMFDVTKYVGAMFYTTPQPTKQEASKPVAWVMFCSDGSYEGPIMDCDRRMEWRRESAAWTPLYTTPQPTPNVQSAVAAAYRKAAEVCDSLHERNCQSITESGCPPCDCYADVFKKAILAIPHDDSALEQYVQERINEYIGKR